MDSVMDRGLELLEQNESFVMAIIIGQFGSTPRNMGTKMIVRENTESIGTIGGGIVEAGIQNLAKEMFKKREPIIKNFVLNKEEVAELDMIYGGNLSVYLKYIDSNNKHYKNVYRGVHNIKREQKRGWLITLIREKPAAVSCKQWLFTEDMDLKGERFEELENRELEDFCFKTKKSNIFVGKNNNRYLIEYLGHINKAYIFGAGHVGHKLAPLLNYVGFYTVVLDDREKYANRNRFPKVNEVVLLDSFHNALDNLHIDENSYIIIVTRGHQYDQTILGQALRTDAAYIGMIGSIAKRDQIYRKLMDEGFSMKELDRVFSPIGLHIGGQTPEEISIRIAAELIDIRAKTADEKCIGAMDIYREREKV